MTGPLIIAMPKGRILGETLTLFAEAGIFPEAAFADDASRQLQFDTNRPDIRLIRIRAFDVATFVAYGAAQMGIVGSDVLAEFAYTELYAPVDLDIGHCRMVVAAPAPAQSRADLQASGRIRIATKYPNQARRHFEARGIQIESIKLHGALEIAPQLGLSSHIVDLVSTGRTLAENGLVETETIAEVSSRLIVNRAAFKTRANDVMPLVEAFRRGAEGRRATATQRCG